MKILVVEDNLERIKKFINYLGKYDLIVTDKANEAIEILNTENFDMIFLDNDLRDGGFGADVATFLSDNDTNLNKDADIVIHSWDDRAIRAMRDKLIQAGFNVIDRRFGLALFKYLGLTNED